MLTELAVENFRGLRELRIERLAPINLFTGLNNAGKTSVLEAVFLLSGGGHPGPALGVSVLRGLVGGKGVHTHSDHWKGLFVNLDVDEAIEIVASHRALGRLTLQVESKASPSVEAIAPNGNGTPASSDAATNTPEARGLSFSFRQGAGAVARGEVQLKGPDVAVSSTAAGVPFPATILVSRGGSVQEDAVRLGKLRREKRGGILLDALRIVEPRLQAIEDISASGAPLIWGDVGLRELVPLSVLGEGMTRIARVVLAISSVPQGVVLVDEIENGLHHSVLGKFWKVVESAAEEFDTQIFATSHSRECVAAAHDALRGESFRLHRLELDGQRSRCVSYGEEAVEGAMKHGLEVR